MQTLGLRRHFMQQSGGGGSQLSQGTEIMHDGLAHRLDRLYVLIAIHDSRIHST